MAINSKNTRLQREIVKQLEQKLPMTVSKNSHKYKQKGYRDVEQPFKTDYGVEEGLNVIQEVRRKRCCTG